MKNINFYLPSFTNNLKLNLALVESKNKHEECFYVNIKFASFFGSFPDAKWNGGRCEFGIIDMDRFKEIVDMVNSLGIAIRYTFTNCLIQEEHLSDEYCNRLMEICDNGMNEVLVNSPLLEKYLRKYYPGFKYILSTTTLTRGAESVNEACKKYDLVVADYRDVPDMQFLKGIEKRNKVEILLNEACVTCCVYREQHYSEISRAQLLLRETEGSKKCMYHDTSKYREAYVSRDTLYNVLIPMGYMNYKIRGRQLESTKLIKEYFSYLVKPECQEIVFKDIKSAIDTTV